MSPSSTPQLSPERFPIGQRVSLPGHFLEPVTMEGIRFIGSGYECRVRLADGTPDEAILSLEEGAALAGQAVVTPATIHPRADAEKLRLLVESAHIRLTISASGCHCFWSKLFCSKPKTHSGSWYATGRDAP
jgi:hypothetical protein